MRIFKVEIKQKIEKIKNNANDKDGTNNQKKRRQKLEMKDAKVHRKKVLLEKLKLRNI